ncbi:hypothetical protein ACU8DI_00425 [Psychroserpens sp. BH13MA-6]
MNKIKTGIFFTISIFFTTMAIAQVEPLYNYDDLELDDEFPGYFVYKIKGQKYYRYDNKIIKNEEAIIYNDVIIRDKDTIYSVKTDDIIYYSIYKKRYLFVSYYPKEQKGSSLGFSIRRLEKVDVIDLKNPLKKWHFNFREIRGPLSLGGISKFKPNTGEIIFNYKFSIDTNNKSKSIPTHNYRGRY